MATITRADRGHPRRPSRVASPAGSSPISTWRRPGSTKPVATADSGKKVEFFPNTGYYLPVIYGITGQEVETLDDMARCSTRPRSCITRPPPEKLWLPYLGETLDAGMAALWLAEIIEALKYVGAGPAPVRRHLARCRRRRHHARSAASSSWTARPPASPPSSARPRTSRPPWPSPARCRRRCLYVFMAGEARGTTFAEQLAEGGVEMGWDTRLVPFGQEIFGHIYSLGFATRAAMAFGGVQAGRLQGHPQLQQEPRLRVRPGAGRGRRREVRGRGRRHQLRLPDHRRHRHPADPADRRLHLRARGLERPPATRSWPRPSRSAASRSSSPRCRSRWPTAPPSRASASARRTCTSRWPARRRPASS